MLSLMSHHGLCLVYRICLAFAVAMSFLPARDVMALDVDPLGADRGLDAQVIGSLLVDQRGFLWVGSREGLYRYDGYQAVRFTPEEGDQHSISDADIRKVYEDPEGIIWVATNNGGLNRYDPISGHFRAYRHNSAVDDSLSNDSIYGMAYSEDGKLWVGTQIGLNLLDPLSGTVQRFLHDPDDPGSLSNDYVMAIHVDQAGSTWITTNGGGVNRWAPERQTFDHFDFASQLDSDQALNSVFAMDETDDGILWFGTSLGLVRLDPENKQLEHIVLISEKDQQLIITDILTDGAGKLWLTTLSDGVLVYDPATGKTTQTDMRLQGGQGQMPAVPYLSLALSDDLLFIGTWGSGIYSGRINSPDFQLLSVRPVDADPRYRNVTAVFAAPPDGRPWVGAFGGGLQQIDVEDSITLAGTEALESIQHNAILALAEVSDGRLFAGTIEGLLEFSASRDSVRTHVHDPANSNSLGPGYVTALLENPDGGLWVGVGGSGLYFLPPESSEFNSFRHDPDDEASLSDDYVTAILQTEPGSLWIGTRSQGLNQCSISPFHCVRFLPDEKQPDGLRHFHVTDIFQDLDGDLWVTTNGGGLNRIELSPSGDVSTVSHRGLKDGLISDAAVSVVQDDDKTIWIGTREGLSRFDPVSNQFENFVAQAGLPASHFNVHAASRDRRFLYFGSLDGLLTIPTSTPFRSRKPSRIGLTSIEMPSIAGAGRPASGLPDSHSMPYGDVVSVGFAVLDFAEVPHRYEYQMGESNEWVSLGSKQDITFFGLAPGNHVLRTRGRDVFGAWSEASPFSIIVIPPFWMTQWFRILMVMVIIFLSVIAHLGRTAALRRRNAELQRLKSQREQALESAQKSEQMLKEAYEGLRGLTSRLESAKEEERRSISRELHDELGQMLTAAKLNLQIARKNVSDPPVVLRLDDSVNMMDSMIAQVRQISMNLRPPLLDEAGLVPALRHYLDQMQQRSGISIPLEVGPGVAGNEPAVRTVVFRVVQEAVNNALRHASASEIKVILRLEENHLCVTVEDNGRGFDPNLTQQRIRRGEHLGLLGMVERVHGVGGEFDVTASPGKGSRIEVRIPR
jgi:signal transduction histidine kinase/ligand-binding sensor domain-containing protein